MSIEYHGWIVLATSHENWDDGDLDQAYSQVGQLLARADPEEGHWALLTDARMLPRMVYLNCIDADSISIPADIIKGIAVVFDRAYGELVVFSGPSLDVWWTHSSVERYILAEGNLKRAPGA